MNINYLIITQLIIIIYYIRQVNCYDNLLEKYAIKNKFIDCRVDCMKCNSILDKYSRDIEQNCHVNYVRNIDGKPNLINECQLIWYTISCYIKFGHNYCSNDQALEYENYWRFWIKIIESNDCDMFLYDSYKP
jgi:hypothetical protein